MKDEMRIILRNEAEAYRRLFHKQIEDEMKETGKDLRTLVREADHTGGMVTQEGEKPSAAHFAALPSVIKDDIRAMYNELGKLVRTYERVKVTSDNTLQIAQYLFQKVE